MTALRTTLEEALCPYCGGSARVWVVSRDMNCRVSGEKFCLLKCNLCGLMFINNPLQDLGRYYTRDYHFVPDSVEALEALLPNEQFKIDLLKKFVSAGAVLEIGPSNGMFCRLAQKAGFEVSAIEMDEDCVRFLNEKLGVRVVASAEPAAVLSSENYTYDAICLWHAIEHMASPWTVLEGSSPSPQSRRCFAGCSAEPGCMASTIAWSALAAPRLAPAFVRVAHPLAC